MANGVLNNGSLIDIPNSVTEYVVPDDANKIRAWAGWQKHNLKIVVVSNSVKEISSYAFRGCRELRHIIIPSSVEKFGNNVFDKCNELQIICPKNSSAYEYATANNFPINDFYNEEKIFADDGLLLYSPIESRNDYFDMGDGFCQN